MGEFAVPRDSINTGLSWTEHELNPTRNMNHKRGQRKIEYNRISTQLLFH